MNRQRRLRQQREKQLRRMTRGEIIKELERFRNYDWVNDERVALKAKHHAKEWILFHTIGKAPTAEELREITISVKANPDKIFTCLDPKAKDQVTWVFIADNVVVVCRAGRVQTCFPVKDLDKYFQHLPSWIDISEWLS